MHCDRGSYASTTPIFNAEPSPCPEDDEQEIVDTSGFKETQAA